MKKEIDLDLSTKSEKRVFILKDTMSVSSLKTMLLEDGCFVGIDSVAQVLEIVKISKDLVTINTEKVLFLK